MTLIREVNQRTDIVALVSEYTSLDTRGRNPKARCPFHSEKTPSFVLYPDEGRWYCFGACSEGGNAIDFLMKKENLEFKEALSRLAEKSGIKLDKFERNSFTSVNKPFTDILAVNKIAADWFATMLSSSSGSEAHAYLAERGLDDGDLKRHSVGFAPDGNLTLMGHLKSREVGSKVALDANLIIPTGEHGWRDFFRNRIMFPIKDARGRIVGFGGRVMGDGNPKYINTPSTVAFEKSAVLYGLDLAAKHIKASSRAVVVEGYMDVIRAHKHGFRNVVASMGVAITGTQRNTLSQVLAASDKGNGEVILCLDADDAGAKATIHALDMMVAQTNGTLSKSGHAIRVASQVKGKDPDEAIRLSPQAWKDALDSATPFNEYLFESLKGRFDLETANGKADAAKSVAPIIFATSNTYEQDRLISRLAEILNVTEGQAISLIKLLGPQRPTGKLRRGELPPKQEQAAALLARNPKTAVEDHLLALLLQYPATRQIAESESANLFEDSINRMIFEKWRDDGESEETDFPPQVHGKISLLLEHKFPPGGEVKRLQSVRECINRLLKRNIKFHIQQIGSQLVQAQAEGQKSEVEALLAVSAKQNENLRRVFAAEHQGRHGQAIS